MSWVEAELGKNEIKLVSGSWLSLVESEPWESALAGSVTWIYSNIRIIATEYFIFEHEYLIFLFRIYSIFIFGQVAKNEYIWYSYLARLGGTNIFYVLIRSGCEERIYSIFVFGEIFPQMDFYLYTLTTRQQKLIRSAQIWNKTCWKYAFWWEGCLQIFHCIYSIFVFVQVAKNEYILYSYLVCYLWTNLFGIRIRSGY